MSDFFDFNQFLGIIPGTLSKQQNNNFQKLINDAKSKTRYASIKLLTMWMSTA